MVSFNYDNNQNVKELILKNGDIITGDLFFDCTGFRSLLNPNPQRVDIKNRLFTDTAIAAQIPFEDKDEEMRPYVISDAVEHGWIWRIPVRTRIGTGLVFNKEITDVETAKDFLINYWGGRVDRDKIKVIDWSPYYNENFWHGNVISIGLSAGFIEPLESTGIALITEGIYQAALRIKGYHYADDDIDIYNSIIKQFFEESIDFVSMHYTTSERTGKFWEYVRANSTISERQRYYIETLADESVKMPSQIKDTTIFNGANWAVWLIQLGWPVAGRKTIFAKDQLEQILLSFNDKTERFRHVWSKHHASEIERLANYYNIE
jgi:tryptophan halogenase